MYIHDNMSMNFSSNEIYRVIKKSLCIGRLQYGTIPTQLIIWRWPSQSTFVMWTVLYWTRSSRTHFSVSINVWRLAGDTLNITCNFLYCNHQVYRDFLITPYFWQVCRQSHTTNFMFNIFLFENSAVYDIMFENTLKSERSQMAIWPMRFACL